MLHLVITIRLQQSEKKNMIPFPEMSYRETGLNTAQQNRREPHQAFKNSPLLRSLIILQTARKMKKNAEVVTDLYTDFFFFSFAAFKTFLHTEFILMRI